MTNFPKFIDRKASQSQILNSPLPEMTGTEKSFEERPVTNSDISQRIDILCIFIHKAYAFSLHKLTFSNQLPN